MLAQSHGLDDCRDIAPRSRDQFRAAFEAMRRHHHGNLCRFLFIVRHAHDLDGITKTMFDHKDFSNNFGLLPITAFAACKIRVLER